MLDETTIDLKNPLTLKDNPSTETYTQITLREPTFEQLIKAEGKPGYEWTMAIVSAVSGIPAPYLKQLAAGDVRVIDRWLTKVMFPTDETEPADVK
jgi:hypothetical protein